MFLYKYNVLHHVLFHVKHMPDVACNKIVQFEGGLMIKITYIFCSTYMSQATQISYRK